MRGIHLALLAERGNLKGVPARKQKATCILSISIVVLAKGGSLLSHNDVKGLYVLFCREYTNKLR